MYSEKLVGELDLPVGLAVFAYGDNWKIDWVNDAFCKIMHIRKTWLSDRTRLERVVYSRDFALLFNTIETVAKEKGEKEVQIRLRGRGKKSVNWVKMQCSYLESGEGYDYLQLVAWNIDAQKNAEHQLQVTRTQYEILEDVTQEVSFDIDVVEWTSLYSRRVARQVLGREVEDHYIPFDEAVLFIHPLDRDLFIRTIREAAKSETTGSMDYRVYLGPQDVEPRYTWYRVFYRSLSDEDGVVTRVIGRGYSIELDRALQDEVRKDPLTKLLNKMETMNAVQRVLSEQKEGMHVLFLIDIDNFKGINDNFGHTFGDTVICDVANAIHKQFRSDDIVGRVGGDEFLVLMKDATPEFAKEKARMLCEQVKREYSGSDTTQVVSISVGLAFYGKDGEDLAALYDKADQAMYRAKKSGKNGFAVATKRGSRNSVPAALRDFDERQEELGEKEREFLNFGYSLLTHARDFDGSLNMLLDRIISHFDLELIAICECNKNGDLLLTNCAGINASAYKEQIFPRDELVPEIHENGKMYTVVRPVFMHYAKTEDAQDVYEERLISACAFSYDGDKEGQLYFLAKSGKEAFSKVEIRSFEELSRTISIFVSLRYGARKNKSRIRELKSTDQLTGLYNFSAFKESVRFLLAEMPPNRVYALEYMDFNNFGYVNENYGYQVGDEALRLFAEDIKSQDFYCVGCHLYSDFFLIFSMDVNRENLMKKIEAQHQRFSEVQSAQYPNGGMGITAGVYFIEQSNVDVEQAFENANLAWRDAKNNRSGIRWFEPSMRRKKLADQRIIAQFYESLYRRDFLLYLQPKFFVGSREVYGAEALVRWKNVEGDVLSPTLFLNPIEQIGYITELDYYMFEETLRLQEKWIQEGRRNMVISTNFSGKHFEGDGKDFLNRIQVIFSKYRVPAACMEIEVTESVLVRNKKVLKDCMTELRRRGFRVAVDDFGTGYSSLSMLSDIPADVVKMDKVFIDRFDKDVDRELLGQIGKLVELSGHDIIFEGVETEEQEQYLIDHGFQKAQGYLCDRAISVAEFEQKYLVFDFEQKTEE